MEKTYKVREGRTGGAKLISAEITRRTPQRVYIKGRPLAWRCRSYIDPGEVVSTPHAALGQYITMLQSNIQITEDELEGMRQNLKDATNLLASIQGKTADEVDVLMSSTLEE